MEKKSTLTIEETCKELNLSKPTVLRLTNTPDFPVFKVGRRKLVWREGLEKWMERQAQEKTT